MAQKELATKPIKERAEKTPKVSGPGPLRAIGGYFKGAWNELRAVRWPDRRNTWGLTVAVLGFTAFFILLILLIDAGFQFLFQEVILK
jgi:preprotein translocase SecE subunit